jgi:hypothetical protein
LNISPDAVMRLAKSAIGRRRLSRTRARCRETVVPLHPARREVADLIAAGAAVPGFGDQLHLAQHRVLAAGDEEAVALVEAVVVAPENGRQVEAEAVDVHLAGQ